MNTITKKIFSFVFLFSIMGLPFLAGVGTLRAAAEDTSLDGTAFQIGRGQDTSGLSQVSTYDIILTVMNWLLIIITILAVIGFIISGIYFITAGGSGRAEDAKQWLTYSIIGIIVALIGYVIVKLVSSLLSGNAGVY